MKIFYRLSDGSYPKIRFPNATKENCLRNFLSEFHDPFDQMFLYADNVREDTFAWLKDLVESYNTLSDQYNIVLQRSTGGSSAASFRLVFEHALQLSDSELVYFVEDDYGHLPYSRALLFEGIARADYVTLYTHRDKFIPAGQGGNIFVGEDGAEPTRVIMTEHSYWMLTNSTTMTFATKVSTLQDDAEIWRKYTMGTYPRDFDAFIELRHKGKTLIMPLPTRSSHMMPEWSAPLIGTGFHSWDDVVVSKK